MKKILKLKFIFCLGVILFYAFFCIKIIHASTLISNDFSGTTIDTSNWTELDSAVGGSGGTAGNVQQNNALTVVGDGSSWSNNGLVSNDAYDRTHGDITIEVDVSNTDCSSGKLVGGVGYGNINISNNPGDMYLVTLYTGVVKLWYFHNGTNTGQVTTFACTNNVSYHVKLVVLQAGGAELYINDSVSPDATVEGGTFTNKPIFFESFSTGVTSTFSDLSVSGTATTLPNIIFDGDSLTYGTGSTDGLDYPAQTITLLGGSSAYDSTNIGVASEKIETMVTNAPNIVDITYASYRDDNFVLIWGGTNDLYFEADDTTVYDYIVSYAEARKNEGFKVAVFTILPRSAGSMPENFETYRLSVNTMLRANWEAFADALVDVAGDSRIGDSGDELDTTYYSGDKVHLNNTGYGIVASLAETAINQMTSYTLTYTAGSHGSISGTSPQTVDYGSDGSAVTAVPDDGYYFVNWSDDSTDNPRTDTNVISDISVTANFEADTNAPSFSSTSASATTDGAVIVWTTNEDSSSKVNYGLTDSYGSSTSETDTGTRVTSHSVTLSGLLSCTVYHYQTQSTDAYTNTGTGDDKTFITSGCTGNASVSSKEQATITIASGGTLTESSLTLTVPSSFTSSVASAVFQANKLDNTLFIATAGTPSGYSQVGTDVYSLKALSDISTAISTFSHALTVVINYSSSDVGTLDESTFQIYRYDGSVWTALDGCSVNTTARTVTCTTQNFSDFAIFGEEGVCPTIDNATTYNAYPSCGVATCNTGYDILNNICVVIGGGGLPVDAYLLPKPPIGGFKIFINNGAETTSSQNITLNFNAGSDIKKMAISLTEDFSDARQENYSPVKQIDLCSKLGGLIKSPTCPDGEYVVYVKFYTAYGASSDIFSAKINFVNWQFSKDLKFGSVDSQVKILQQFLNQNGYKLADVGWGSPGKETNFFGYLTSSALEKFQEENKDGDTRIMEERGFLGPITRQFINSFVAVKKTTISSEQIQDSSSAIFMLPLYIGLQSEDVRRLQTLFATRPEIYPEGKITGYFGQLTKKAVQNFQLKYGVVDSEFDPGFGYVGPKTRIKLKEIFGS